MYLSNIYKMNRDRDQTSDLTKECDGPIGSVNQDTLDKFLNLFFTHQTIIKMSHFATDSYAIHK